MAAHGLQEKITVHDEPIVSLLAGVDGNPVETIKIHQMIFPLAG